MSITSMPPRLLELAPLLYVDDIQRSVDFYCQMLGFTVSARWEPEGKLAWCRLERDGVPLMLQQANEEDAPAASRGRGVVFFFQCNDAGTLHAELSSRGLPLSPPEAAFYGMNQVFVKDPDGYELCFQNAIADEAH